MTLEELAQFGTAALAQVEARHASLAEFDIQMRLFTAAQMQLAVEADERQAAALERIAVAVDIKAKIEEHLR